MVMVYLSFFAQQILISIVAIIILLFVLIAWAIKKIVKEKFVQFVNILNKNSYRTSDDVMPFVLSLFRQMRNQTHEKKEPLEALNLLYKLLISLQEDNINSTVCEKWGILDIDEPQGFDTLIEYIRKGCRNIQPNLDLILRHSSGVLFQEAHREALSFDTQYNLFGEMSSSIELKSPTLYSSIHYTPQYIFVGCKDTIIILIFNTLR